MRAFGLGDEDLTAWRESGLAGDAFDDWLIDRTARRPSGSRARAVYGAEDVHDFVRRPVLDALALDSSDHLLEVGCGGGLLLRDALATSTPTKSSWAWPARPAFAIRWSIPRTARSS
jgi:hypothetical protein